MKVQGRYFSCSVVVYLAVTAAGLLRSAEPESVKTPADQFAALTREYEDQVAAFYKDYNAIKGAAEKRDFDGEHFPAPEKFYPRFLELAETYRDDPIAVDALAWVANNLGRNLERDEAIHRRPFDILLRDHLASDKLPIAFDNANDDFLRTVLEKSPHREVRGLADFTLAEHQIWRIAALCGVFEMKIPVGKSARFGSGQFMGMNFW